MFDDFKSKAIDKCFKDAKTVTPQRLRILETLYNEHKPLSAYEIRDHIEDIGTKFNIATIYRVLDFWCDMNVVHRVSAFNKFVCCANPDERHTHIINCCQKCETLTESCNEKMGLDIDNGMNALGMQLARNSHLEIPVICSSCA